MNYYAKLFLVLCLAAGMAGCASPPSRFYTLNSTAKAGEPLAACTVVVGPVFVPATIDRPQFVTVTSPNQVEFDEFNRWAGPLSENISSVVSADLGKLLGTAHAASEPMPGFGPAYHVTLRIEHFERVRGTGKTVSEALVDAVWAVRTPANQDGASGHTLAREPVQGDDNEALVAAYSRALAGVSADIAAAIRAVDGKK